MTTTKSGRRFAKGVAWAAVMAATVVGVRKLAPSLFGEQRATATPTVPPKAELPQATAPAAGQAPAVALPTSDKPGCPDRPEIRMLVWAWNAQQGLLFANGGPRATEGSLMCGRGVNLAITRQDMVDQMQAELVKCASEIGAGAADCKAGAHYVAIMGDGAPAFLAALEPQLAKVCHGCTAEIVGSAGYSRGEDKLLGKPAWKQEPSTAAGALLAGVLRDGDWNIAMKWAGDNNLCNNPDDTTYDPACLNWVNAADYIDAANKYVANHCEDRPVVQRGKRTGDTRRVCVDGVVTWTPGDVTVAQKRGGLVSIASTREYAYQMPNVIVGLRQWDRTHRDQVIAMLGAMTDGGQQVKQHAAARRRAAEISAVVYKEQDAAYWLKYADVVVERDATGLTVELGGSAVNNLADNLMLFGNNVDRGIFAATYRVFGDIAVHYYPEHVPRYPPVGAVVDTSYLEALAVKAPSRPVAQVPVYSEKDPSPAEREVVGHKSWQINFVSGSATFTPGARSVLDQLHDQTVVTHTIIEITGHTDADGDAETNRELSRRRALAVRDYLIARSPASFTIPRFRVTGLGEDAPLFANDTSAHKAKNRRVEIAMRAK